MSIKDFDQAIELIKKHEDKIHLVVPQSIKNIEQAEKALNLSFPKSYKRFLEICGSLSIGSQDIFGLTNNNDFSQYIYENIVCNTLDERLNQKDPSFQTYLIPIHALGNGELSCLDTSQMNEEGECPVVAWYFGATLPDGKLEILAEDFGAFLLEKVQWGLKSLGEDK